MSKIWYRKSKYIFTRFYPITLTHILNYSFFIQKHIGELTVNIISEERAALWKACRVIFVSSALLQNDLRMGAYDCKDLKCIIFDDTQRTNASVIKTIERIDASIPADADTEVNSDAFTDEIDPQPLPPPRKYRTIMFSELVSPMAPFFQQSILSRAEVFGERDPEILRYYDEGAKVMCISKTTPQIRAVCQALDERFIQYHLGAVRRMGIAFKPRADGEVCGDAARVMKIIAATKEAAPLMHRMDLYTLYALFSCRDTLLVNGVTSFLTFVSHMNSVEYVSKYCNFHTRRDWMDFVTYCKGTLSPRNSNDIDNGSDENENANEIVPHPKLKALEKFFKKYFSKHPSCWRAVILTHFEDTRQDVLRWLGRLSNLVRLDGERGGAAALPIVSVVLESKSAQFIAELCERGAAAQQRGLVVCFEYESFASRRIQYTQIKDAAKVVVLAMPGEEAAVLGRLGELGAAERSAELAKLYAAVGTGFGPSPRVVPAGVGAQTLSMLKDDGEPVPSAKESGGNKKRKRKSNDVEDIQPESFKRKLNLIKDELH